MGRKSIWKTIKLGTFKNAAELLGALRAAGYEVSDWARDLLNNTRIVNKKTKVDLVFKTLDDLGLGEYGVSYEQITARALKLGYQPCPAEVGPQLRLQYKDQPVGEVLIIVMETTCGSSGVSAVFSIERDSDSLQLDARYRNPDGLWHSYPRFVFVCPRR